MNFIKLGLLILISSCITAKASPSWNYLYSMYEVQTGEKFSNTYVDINTIKISNGKLNLWTKYDFNGKTQLGAQGGMEHLIVDCTNRQTTILALVNIKDGVISQPTNSMAPDDWIPGSDTEVLGEKFCNRYNH